MVIQIDSREKKIHRDRITAGFDFLRVKWFVSKLPFGDYMSLDNPKLVVDRKHDLAEVAANFTQERFLNEMKGAQLYGIKLIFLVEHGNGIDSIEAVQNWVNPRLAESPMALSGDRIFRKMLAYQNTYGVEFRFCERCRTALSIAELLGGEFVG